MSLSAGMREGAGILDVHSSLKKWDIEAYLKPFFPPFSFPHLRSLTSTHGLSSVYRTSMAPGGGGGAGEQALFVPLKDWAGRFSPWGSE